MKTIFYLLAFLLIFSACNNEIDRDEPLGSYDNGILVLNEGGAGTVTYMSSDLSTVRQDIFGTVNTGGQDLGQYVQSMFFDDDRAFIISNGSDKITVVNRYTFQYVATISTGLSVPRYGVVQGGKAYVTNMASFFSETDDYVAVIDLNDYSLGSPIAIGRYAERITTAGGKVYVANGAFGSGNGVTVINPVTASIETWIETGLAPNSLEAHDGFLYVLCAGYGVQSMIYKINTSNHATTLIPVDEAIGEASNLDIEGNFAYFTSGPKVYKTPLNATSVSGVELFDTESTSPYIGYGFAVNNNRIYISEAAADFASDGRALIYSTNGNFIAEVPTGLGPNGFYFN